MDSTKILDELRKRNQFVFKKLFEDNYEGLVNHAHRYLYDIKSCEDIVQDAFIHLWEKADEINVKSNLTGYLYTMVKNKCLNRLNSIKITDNENVIETYAMFEDENVLDFVVEEEKRNMQVRISRALDELPKKMRLIVKLRFVNNYKYSQISDELGISINTVKTQLKRAKKKFQGLSTMLWCFF